MINFCNTVSPSDIEKHQFRDRLNTALSSKLAMLNGLVGIQPLSNPSGTILHTVSNMQGDKHVIDVASTDIEVSDYSCVVRDNLVTDTCNQLYISVLDSIAKVGAQLKPEKFPYSLANSANDIGFANGNAGGNFVLINKKMLSWFIAQNDKLTVVQDNNYKEVINCPLQYYGTCNNGTVKIFITNHKVVYDTVGLVGYSGSSPLDSATIIAPYILGEQTVAGKVTTSTSRFYVNTFHNKFFRYFTF